MGGTSLLSCPPALQVEQLQRSLQQGALDPQASSSPSANGNAFPPAAPEIHGRGTDVEHVEPGKLESACKAAFLALDEQLTQVEHARELFALSQQPGTDPTSPPHEEVPKEYGRQVGDCWFGVLFWFVALGRLLCNRSGLTFIRVPNTPATAWARIWKPCHHTMLDQIGMGVPHTCVCSHAGGVMTSMRPTSGLRQAQLPRWPSWGLPSSRLPQWGTQGGALMGNKGLAAHQLLLPLHAKCCSPHTGSLWHTAAAACTPSTHACRC